MRGSTTPVADRQLWHTVRPPSGHYEKLIKHFFLGSDSYLCCTWPTGRTPLCLLHIYIRLIVNSKLGKSFNSHYLRPRFVCFQSKTDRVSVTSLISAERIIEDHESVMEVLSGWGMDTDSRLYFRKNYAKYEFFRKPLVRVWLCFSPFQFWDDPVHLHYCKHWQRYFIIVGFFPRSHAFHISWNERDHGSFPARTGTCAVLSLV